MGRDGGFFGGQLKKKLDREGNNGTVRGQSCHNPLLFFFFFPSFLRFTDRKIHCAHTEHKGNCLEIKKKENKFKKINKSARIQTQFKWLTASGYCQFCGKAGERTIIPHAEMWTTGKKPTLYKSQWKLWRCPQPHFLSLPPYPPPSRGKRKIKPLISQKEKQQQDPQAKLFKNSGNVLFTGDLGQRSRARTRREKNKIKKIPKNQTSC